MPLMLIAVPVIVLVAFAHSMLRRYAPSNVLVRRVRTSRPTLGLALALGLLAFGCALALHAIHLGIVAGAPDWLNLVALVLAWDAIKFAVMACLAPVRRVCIGYRRASPPTWSGGLAPKGSRHVVGRGASRTRVRGSTE